MRDWSVRLDLANVTVALPTTLRLQWLAVRLVFPPVRSVMDQENPNVHFATYTPVL